jgi:hypothetical protein
MTRQTLKALRDVESARDHRILVSEGLQLRLALDGLRQSHRRCRILRHQLGEPVYLPVRHLQHAADVAQHAARLQRPEGDDLPDLLAAVALLHVTDHLAAAVLTEVDVEVRHRHAFRIEKALEQQAEPDGIEVGNGQRIGDQRSGARTAARTDRNALSLSPLDEVRHDQEVARIVHAGDDIELEGKTFAVILLGHARRETMQRQTPRKTFRCLAAQLAALFGFRIAGVVTSHREARKDRLACPWPVRAPPRDLDGGRQRFRQIGEQHGHFGACFEAMVRRQLITVGFRHQTAARDAEQRVVRLVIVGGGEIRLVGRDQRQAHGIGHVDQDGFAAAFVLKPMALQFDVEPVTEQFREDIATRLSQNRQLGADGLRDHSFRSARQRDQPAGFTFQPLDLDMRRLVDRRVVERAGVQLHQAAIAVLVGRQQHKPRGRKRAAGSGVLIAEIDRHRAAGNGLDTVGRELVRKLQRAEHVVVVGQRQRGLMIGLGKFSQLADRHRPLQQRISRMHVQMNESGVRRGRLRHNGFGHCGPWQPSRSFIGAMNRPR